MVTAEPNYAVVDPSSQVVLYSVKEGSAAETRALSIGRNLFYFTHYPTYESTPGNTGDPVPNQLLQARKAVELASKSSSAVPKSTQRATLKEEEYTQEALEQARTFLARAEAAYTADPRGQDVIQFARTAAQSAENARALAMGAVGGILVRQLEQEVKNLEDELANRREAPAPPAIVDPVQPVKAINPHVPIPVTFPVTSPPLVKQPAMIGHVDRALLGTRPKLRPACPSPAGVDASPPRGRRFRPSRANRHGAFRRVRWPLVRRDPDHR
jgi:hypothetical protein